jgi:integrase
MHTITPAQLDDFLRTRTEGWDRANFYKRVRHFLNHAKRRRWLLENPCEELSPPKTPGGKREVYRPEQFEALLMNAHDSEVKLFLALAALAFMRTRELVRRYAGQPVLEWEHILWDRRLIHVPENVAKATRRKSGSERFTPICPALAAWLGPLDGRTGRIIATSDEFFRRKLRVVFESAGVQFLPNALRHSAISYWLAAHSEAGIGEVARYAGNSEPSCRVHYLRLLSEEDGERWYSTLPPGAPKPKKAEIFVGDDEVWLRSLIEK